MAKKKEEKGGPMGMCMSMIKKGKESGGFFWFPLIPVIIGGSIFALGWYLDPAVIRILWLAASGLIAFMGLMMLIVGNLMFKSMGK